MNCEKVEALLLDFIEGELDEQQSREIQAHADDCPVCRLNIKETRELFEALDEARQRQKHSLLSTPSARSPATAGGPSVWQAGSVLGDFEILGELGRGGMGVVYRAKQMSLNRIVALKVLPGTVCQTKKSIARFKKEARAAAKLHHTHIVPVYAQGEHEGHFYYAMELIDGSSLDRVMKADPSIGVPAPSESRQTHQAGNPQPRTRQ